MVGTKETEPGWRRVLHAFLPPATATFIFILLSSLLITIRIAYRTLRYPRFFLPVFAILPPSITHNHTHNSCIIIFCCLQDGSRHSHNNITHCLSFSGTFIYLLPKDLNTFVRTHIKDLGWILPLASPRSFVVVCLEIFRQNLPVYHVTIRSIAFKYALYRPLTARLIER